MRKPRRLRKHWETGRARSAIAALALIVLAIAAGAFARPAVADLTSSNWAGYVAMGFGSTPATASTGLAFTDVTGQWVQPKATCVPGTPTSVAVWVGLGGFSETSNELEQAGTEADCDGNGKATYTVWYELVPASSVTVKGLRIYPGDVISSTVLIDHGRLLVQVTDRTRNRRFTRRIVTASSDLTTAEWIVEAPAQCGGTGSSACSQSSLTNFGTVQFSRAAATGNATSGTLSGSNWMTVPLQLVPTASRTFGSSQNVQSNPASGAGATTSALAGDGRGFTVSWQARTS
jgi:Peptidase A4 family